MEALDWASFDDKSFHRMVNALLQDILGAHYQAGDPDGGSDGGWDGRYDGPVPFFPDLPAGLWMFQAKQTAKRGAEAVQHLRKELQGAKGKLGDLEKASRANVDHLVVLTSAMLQSGHKTTLKELRNAAEHRCVLHVLARADLEPMVRERRWLLSDFFNQKRAPLLRPIPSDERKADPWARYGIPQVYFVERATLIDGPPPAGNVQLLVAQGGVGKSRLLREWARIATQDAEPPLVRALEPRDCSSLGEELRDDRRYLLVVDDAESLLEERLITAVRAVHENPGRRSVIAAIRPSAKHYVQQAFRKAQFPEPEFIDVPQMGQYDQLRLIEGLTPGLTEKQRRRLIAGCGGNLVLLLDAARAAGHEPPGPPELRPGGALLERFTREVQRTLESIEVEQPGEFLPLLAALAPLDELGPHLDQVAARLSMSIEAFARAREALQRNALLRNGPGIRFNLDVMADLVLWDRLGLGDGPSLFAQWRSAFPKLEGSLVRALADALGYPNPEGRRPVVQRLFNDWRGQLGSFGATGRLRILRHAGWVARHAPADALELLSAALGPATFPGPSSGSEGNAQLQSMITMEVAIPLLVHAGSDPQLLGHALEILGRHPIPDGAYADHSVAALVKAWLHPFSPNVGHPTLFATCKAWLAAPMTTLRLTIIEAAVTAGLAESYEIRRWDEQESSLHFGAVRPEEAKAGPARAGALAVLKEALAHPATEIRRAAARWAGHCWSVVGWSSLPPFPPAMEERQSLLAWIGQRISEEADILVLSELESLVLRWWACHDPLETEAFAILSRWPRSLAYRIFRLDDPITPVTHANQLRGPTGPRWRWLLDQRVRLTDEGTEAIVDELHAIEASGLVALLMTVPETKGDSPWLSTLMSHSPDLRAELAQDGALKILPPSWVSRINLILDAQDSTRLKDLAVRCTRGAPMSLAEAQRLFGAISRSQWPISVELLLGLVASGDEGLKRGIEWQSERLAPRERAQVLAALIGVDPRSPWIRRVEERLFGVDVAQLGVEDVEPLLAHLITLARNAPADTFKGGRLLVTLCGRDEGRVRAAITTVAKAHAPKSIDLWSWVESEDAPVKWGSAEVDIEAWMTLARSLEPPDRGAALELLGRRASTAVLEYVETASASVSDRQALLRGLVVPVPDSLIARLLEETANADEAEGVLSDLIDRAGPQVWSVDPTGLLRRQRLECLRNVERALSPTAPSHARTSVGAKIRRLEVERH